jgi:hypothetical protein
VSWPGQEEEAVQVAQIVGQQRFGSTHPGTVGFALCRLLPGAMKVQIPVAFPHDGEGRPRAGRKFH